MVVGKQAVVFEGDPKQARYRTHTDKLQKKLRAISKHIVTFVKAVAVMKNKGCD